MFAWQRERERERRNSDKSEDGYHSDGDYGEHDYRNDINDEKESKTIMLRGLPITVTDYDVNNQLITTLSSICSVFLVLAFY